MSQKIMGYPVVIDDTVDGWELVPPHAIKTRHVLAAIPGDTPRQKLDWIKSAKVWLLPVLIDTDMAARVAVMALGEIETVIGDYANSPIDEAATRAQLSMSRITKIVAAVD